jgi:hypothetical protein
MQGLLESEFLCVVVVPTEVAILQARLFTAPKCMPDLIPRMSGPYGKETRALDPFGI